MRLRTKVRLWCLAHLLIVVGACSLGVFISQKHLEGIFNEKVVDVRTKVSTTNVVDVLDWFKLGSVFVWD